GQAGPCLLRDPGFQPVAGAMHFDTADVAGLLAAGKFDEVVRHEMGHVLGFGTIWQSLGLVPGAGGTDPHFVGAQATAAFDHNGGQPYSAGAKVPVENCCGSGTRDSHWRETVFETELMTGFLNSGVPNPIRSTHVPIPCPPPTGCVFSPSSLSAQTSWRCDGFAPPDFASRRSRI